MQMAAMEQIWPADFQHLKPTIAKSKPTPSQITKSTTNESCGDFSTPNKALKKTNGGKPNIPKIPTSQTMENKPDQLFNGLMLIAA